LSEETGAPAGGEAIAAAPAELPSELTAESAARLLAEQRWKKDNPETTPAAAKPAAVETPEELPEEASSDPETDPAETTEEAEPEELPPIEPPRSWTKAEKERFASLPRETQEYLHTREQERDREFRRSQNEIAEQRKAIQAERDAAEKAKQQYETQLPALLRELESVNQAQFGDIRTMEDVVKLQAEDPFRFQAWQVHQMRLQATKSEADRAEGQKAQEKQSKRANYELEQNKLLIELVPEMADPKKASELRERAISLLTDDLGLKNDQLSRWMQDDTGHEILSNAGIQKLIADGLKYRDILKAPKAVAAKPVPPVLKPGTAPAKGGVSERIQALQKTFERDPSVENATALRLARLKRA
jgi:hypothetical protein